MLFCSFLGAPGYFGEKWVSNIEHYQANRSRFSSTKLPGRVVSNKAQQVNGILNLGYRLRRNLVGAVQNVGNRAYRDPCLLGNVPHAYCHLLTNSLGSTMLLPAIVTIWSQPELLDF